MHFMKVIALSCLLFSLAQAETFTVTVGTKTVSVTTGTVLSLGSMSQGLPLTPEVLQALIAAKYNVVIDFFATWCGPCRSISPTVDGIAQRYANVIVIKVNIDSFKDVTQRYGVSSMPTFLFFKNGVSVERFSGADQAKLTTTFSRLYH
jgi:thioredoxin